MLEQKINEFFRDDDPTGFGTGWWSGVLSAFFGLLAFGAVVCLHFPAGFWGQTFYPFTLRKIV